MYNYQTEKPKLFTEDGQADFLKVRDKSKQLITQAGAFQAWAAMGTGDSWFNLACLDRLVEMGELRKIDNNYAAQHWIFIKGTN